MLKKILTDKLLLSLLGVIAVFLASVAWIISGVVGQPLFRGTPSIKADLTETGGLYVGSPVSYHGVNVGKVTAINLVNKGKDPKDGYVEATFSITTGVTIPGPPDEAPKLNPDGTPATPYARVRSLSPVGEQYLDLEPGTNAGPALKDGDTIKADTTNIPVTLGHTVESLDSLLHQIDEKKLQRLLSTAAAGFANTGNSLGQSFDNMHLLLNDLVKVQPQTIDLLHNVGPTLDLVNNHAGELQSLADSANAWTTYLDANKADLVTLLQQTPGNLKTLQGLIDSWGQILPTFFPTALKFGAFTTQHNPSIRALLQTYQPGISALAGTISGNTWHLLLVASTDMRCTGYGTTHHSPKTTGTTMQPNAHCSAVVRGESAKLAN